jgi:phosphomannomutase
MKLKQRKELRKKYVDKMKEQILNNDTEEAHGQADDLLCELLRQLGFNSVVDEYEKVHKWYA